jgi:hypothetical protein
LKSKKFVTSHLPIKPGAVYILHRCKPGRATHSAKRKPGMQMAIVKQTLIGQKFWKAAS